MKQTRTIYEHSVISPLLANFLARSCSTEAVSQKLVSAKISNKGQFLKMEVVGAYSRGRLLNTFADRVGAYSRGRQFEDLR